MVTYCVFVFTGSQIAALAAWIQSGWIAYEGSGFTAVFFPSEEETEATVSLSELSGAPSPVIQTGWNPLVPPELSPWAQAVRLVEVDGNLSINGSAQPLLLRCVADDSLTVTLPDQSTGAWAGVRIEVFVASIDALKIVTVAAAGTDAIRGGDLTLTSANQSLSLIGGQAGEWLAL